MVGVLLVLWELSVASGAVRSTGWPALSTVLAALLRGFQTEAWFDLFGSTLYRMAIGFLIAVVLGIGAGLAMGASSLIHRTFMPTVEIFRVLPIPAVVPPLIFFLGVDDPLKITVIALASFFPIALNTFAGVRAIDPMHMLVARTFRIPGSRVLFEIQLPSALPYVLAGCRISLAISFIVTVVSEMIAGSAGVGYYIVSMQYAMRADDMYAAIILLSGIGYLLNRVFLGAELRVIHWARELDARREE